MDITRLGLDKIDYDYNVYVRHHDPITKMDTI